MNATGTATTASRQHPLDPLTGEEIEAAARIFRIDAAGVSRPRFVSIEREEPPKELILGWSDDERIDRRAFLVVRDAATGRTFEAVVSLTNRRLVVLDAIAAVQSAGIEEDFALVERLVKEDPRWQAAMRMRGVEDFTHVLVDAWPAAYLSEQDAPTRRLSRPLTFVGYTAEENAYGHPVEGLSVVVDLDLREVVEVIDHGVVDIPCTPAEYTEAGVQAEGNIPRFAGPRTDVAPLHVTQPEGPGFTVDGYEVRWQKWCLRVGFTPREGLVLHTVSYDDRGTVRSIAYRMSISEMVVPYGDPAPIHVYKSAFDGGEEGLGVDVNSLERGCDCLGEVHYLRAALTDADGQARVVDNAICIHEEDYGVLWKHTDYRTGKAEVRRSRRLAISFFATIANYDYGFFWYFYQDGTIQCEIKLTGIMSMGAHPADQPPRHGVKCAPGLYAPHHQHFFNARLDMAVDGQRNTVVEVDSHPDPAGPENPYGNAWRVTATPLARESQAQRDIDPRSARYWTIINQARCNHVGEPVGYRLVPGDNAFPMLHQDAPALNRAGFIRHHLWVTKYSARERFAAGDYPYQNSGGAGLPQWVQQDRPLVNEDVVVWYTFGAHHIARPEDWPVMPVSYIGFHLKPSGFFDGNPALDVPVPSPHHPCRTT